MTTTTKPTKRVWVSKHSHSSVRQWTWTRTGGLWVTYKDGMECKSDHGTLPVFLKAVAEGREAAVEVINGERADGLPLVHDIDVPLGPRERRVRLGNNVSYIEVR
jgi:hypothetical protein